MNQKLCKKIRRFARELAANNGYPEHGYLEGAKNSAIIDIDENGMPITFQYTGTVKVDPKTFRGIYRTIKKARNKVTTEARSQYWNQL